MKPLIIKILFVSLLPLLMMTSCKSEYDQYVKREMASGILHDSLIFDMRTGITKKDFYAVCWDLNKTQAISQGSGNKYARYIEPENAVADKVLRKQMDFFGIFEEDVMHGMEMIYSYIAWSPQNAKLQSEPLALDLKEIYSQSYAGNPFIEIDLKSSGYRAFAKIDGNRQILIYPKNNKEVMVLIEDLNFKYKKQ